MTTSARGPHVGDLLRDWRKRRRLSQLDLALEAEVSARHLSFIEGGRSRPSRDLLIHLARQLDVPLREQNTMLLAAGYAPEYGESALDAPRMIRVRGALDRILDGHEPYPAIAVDRHFDLVAANGIAFALLTAGVDAELLKPPVNVLRVAIHPRGLAPRTLNSPEWNDHLLSRLHRQAAASGDPALAELETELRGYCSTQPSHLPAEDPQLYVPLILEGPEGGELRLFSTISTFGTALDVTMAELAIEAFFPADEFTAGALQAISERVIRSVARA